MAIWDLTTKANEIKNKQTIRVIIMNNEKSSKNTNERRGNRSQ